MISQEVLWEAFSHLLQIFLVSKLNWAALPPSNWTTLALWFGEIKVKITPTNQNRKACFTCDGNEQNLGTKWQKLTEIATTNLGLSAGSPLFKKPQSDN